MKNCRAKQNTHGFTLVEVIVTLVLMGILLGIGVASFSAYTRYTRFRRQNETAQTLFTAAQAKLTQAVADGGARTLALACEESAVAMNDQDMMLVSLTDRNGSTITADGIWANRGGADYGTLYAVMGSPSDYEQYRAWKEGKSGAQAPSAAITALYSLLEEYLYDSSVLNASVCVEIDPSAGLVYSVLYAQDAKNGFSYTGDLAKTDIRNRTEKARKSRMVGYFGVDSLSTMAQNKQEYVRILDAVLDNGDTLDLNWTVDQDHTDAAATLSYQICLYDTATQSCALKLEINHWDAPIHSGNMTFVSLAAADKTLTIEAHVWRKNPKANPGEDPMQDLGSYTFPAYIDQTGRLHLILDAADLGATEAAYRSELALAQIPSSGSMKNSFSMHRFYLESLGVQDVIAGVSVLADGQHQASTERKTSPKSLYFLSTSSITDSEMTYAISSARHLYNMRYASTDSGKTDYYTLTGDLSWKNFAKGGNLYNTGIDGWSTAPDHSALQFRNQLYAGVSVKADGSIVYIDVDFPSISQLYAGSVFQSRDTDKCFTITDISVSSETNKAVQVPGFDTATGLFLYNFGTMRDIALDEVKVIGEENVGSFCGLNCGSLSRLSVSGGAVYGLTNVGGVFGALGLTAQLADTQKNGWISFSKLTNHAMVTGHTYVGGIAGRIDGGKRYLRGNAGEENSTRTVSVELADCENTGAVRGDWQALASASDAKIKAIYTGLDFAQRTASGGYVSDARYIGGITGYAGGKTDDTNSQKQSAQLDTACRLIRCSSVPSLSQAEQSAVTAGADALRGTAVGGIIGCAEHTFVMDCTAKTEKNSGTVSGSRLVGGIIGAAYSGTTLENCSAALVAVNGRNYVGGLAGCMDDTAAVSDCSVNGGTVTGRDFVGGFSGLDCSGSQLFGEVSCTVAPAAVTGRFCVGGCFGAKLYCAQGQPYSVSVAVENETGAVHTQEAFAGGFAGLVTTVASPDGWVPPLLLEEDASSHLALITFLQGGDQLENDIGRVDAAFAAENMLGGAFSITGISGKTSVLLSSVDARVYAGGIVGYIPDGTQVTLSGLSNAAAVSTGAALSATSEPQSLARSCSYTGGIVGRCGIKATISNCTNTGTVRAAGGYAGGLAGVNAGSITSCTVQSFGSDEQSGVGGLTGINTATGTILQCSLSGATIHGATAVGGVAACNFGLIQMIDVSNGSIIASSANAGGIAAENCGAGKIVLPSDRAVSGISVSGTSCVGVVAGRCEGSGAITGENDAAVTLDSGCRATGETMVGGIAGWAGAGVTMQKLESAATIMASGQYAGGIAGLAEVRDGAVTQFINCKNYGTVTGSAKAGGILGASMATPGASSGTLKILQCENHGQIGQVGTISGGGIFGSAGENASQTTTISGCINTGVIFGDAASNGGIAGKSDVLELLRCINYGFSDAGSTDTAFCGMTPSVASMTGCVGVAGCAYPLAFEQDGSTTTKCYYFKETSAGLGVQLAVQPESGGANFLAYVVGGDPEQPAFTALSADPRALDATTPIQPDLIKTGAAQDNARYLLYVSTASALMQQISA